MDVYYTWTILILVILASGENSKDECISPQYMELGKRGVVYCHFQESFYGVYWYNSSNVASDPIVFLKDSVKGGEGYVSGDFDVSPDGSLKVNKVTLKHDKVFSVMKFTSSKDEPIFLSVRVIIIVKPTYSYPVIVGCNHRKEVCFKHIRDDSELKCSVTDSRPAVNLRWHVRTALGDKDISSLATISNGSIVQTSTASTFAAFNYTNLLSLLVCKANGTREVINQMESEVIVLSKDVNCSSTVSNVKYFEQNENLDFKCGDEDSDHSLLVWMRRGDTNCDYLLYASNGFIQKNFDDFDLDHRGSLVVERAGTQHEGSYYCIFGDGITDSLYALNAVFYAQPFPPYLVINGCNLPDNCILEVQNEGFIKCSVYGIRPLIQLDMRVENAELTSLIVFTNQTLEVKRSGDTFDIALKSEFHAQPQLQRRLKLICATSGPNAEVFSLSTEFELFFIHAETSSFTSQVQPIFIVVLATFLVVLVSLTVFGVILWKAHRRSKEMMKRTREDTAEETHAMLAINKHGNKEDFIPDDWNNESHALVTIICKRQFEQLEIRYSLQENLDTNQNNGNENLRVVILGKSGVGKSATANSLLGEHVFNDDMGTLPTTVTPCVCCREIEGLSITVIETRGLFDCDRKRDSIYEDIATIITRFRNGIHAFIYVFNIAAPRFTQDDLEAVRAVEKAFGKRSENYRGIVFSHAESLDDNMDLEQFWSKQKEGRDGVASFFCEFGTRVVAVNNKCKVKSEKKRNQNAIIKLIDSIQEFNNNKAFSNELLERAITERLKLSKAMKSKHWNKVIVASVENVIAAYPYLEVKTDEFIDKVNEELILQKESYEKHSEMKLKSFFNSKKGAGKEKYHLTKQVTDGDTERDDTQLYNQVVEIYQEFKVLLKTVKESLDTS